MHISNNGIELITKYEGFRGKAYKCPAGVWTIGWGTTIYPNGKSVKPEDTCTKSEALTYFKKDIIKFESIINKIVQVQLTQNMYDALVSWAYNVGSRPSSTLIKLLNQKNYKGCADQFPLWCKAGGVKLNGLVRRRKEEQTLFLKDIDSLTNIIKINKYSSIYDIIRLQAALNKIDVGLPKLILDGCYGIKTKEYLLCTWTKWNWNKDNKSSGWTAGKKTLTKLNLL